MKYNKQLIFKATGTDDENYIIRGIFSTSDQDRQGEIIDQNGWKLDEYMTNPVVLFAHDHWQPAIGKMIELGKDAKGNLVGAIQFAVKEYDFAKTIYNLYKGGYMRAFSVGFETPMDKVEDVEGAIILREANLYEVSAVNVPANQMALAYSKGIDISPLQKALKDKRDQEAKEKKKAEKSPVCRMDGETKDECVARKIPEMVADGMEQEQAVAAAENVCMTMCEDKSTEEAIEKITKSNKETIQSAIKTLTDVLQATGIDNKVDKVETPEKGDKKISVKLLNRAIRELLALKKINK
jgi:uncharacterized protein